MIAAVGEPVRAVPAKELDRDTLERCRSGDQTSLRAFVIHYERPVFALLSRLLGHVPEVDDLAQETFLRAIRALPGFDPEGPAQVSTWLLTIATRLGIDRLKKRPLRLEPVVDGASDERHSPELETSRGELRRAIARAVDALPADQRSAFVLAEFHDFSLAQISAALGIKENTVKTRLFRARDKLSRALAEFGGKR
jgi:RNA polymerase sigma-70 factor (ECF subfamily)